MSFLIDTYGMPSDGELGMSGCIGATRYVSHDSGKCVTSAQVKHIHSKGKRVVLNFEDSATNAQGGKAQGIADATFSIGVHHRIGAPAHVANYSSADYEVHPGWGVWDRTIAYYRDGWTPTLHDANFLSGAYGCYDLVKYLLDHKIVDFAWQCEAWSYGKVDPRAVMLQDKYTDAYDEDALKHDLMGAWMPNGAQVNPNADPLEELMAMYKDKAAFEAALDRIVEKRVAAESASVRKAVIDEFHSYFSFDGKTPHRVTTLMVDILKAFGLKQTGKLPVKASEPETESGDTE